MTEKQTKKITKSIDRPFSGSREMPGYESQDNLNGFDVSITTGKPRPKSRE